MELILDSQIRDWVFIPILYIMFMMGIFKMELHNIMNAGPKENKVTSQIQVQKNSKQQVLQKAKTFQSLSGLLSPAAFAIRKDTYVNGQALYHAPENPADADPMAQLSGMNPNMMTGMLKNNLFMTVATPIQFGLVSYFFSGFLIGRVPFPLTQKFRDMLQSGIEVVGLDVKFISSLSLYFLTLFGFSALYKLISPMNSEDMPDDMAMMNPMAMNPMMGQSPMGQPPAMDKIFKEERDNIGAMRHTFLLENADQQLLAKVKKMKLL